MEFEHREHWELYQTVGECLEREVGEDVEAFEQEPGFVVRVGAVPMVVSVGGAGPKAAVTIYARPADGLEVTPELALLMLRANFGHDIPFGTLGLTDELRVSFSHVVMGEGFNSDAFGLLLHLLSSKLDDIESMLAGHLL